MYICVIHKCTHRHRHRHRHLDIEEMRGCVCNGGPCALLRNRKRHEFPAIRELTQLPLQAFTTPLACIFLRTAFAATFAAAVGTRFSATLPPHALTAMALFAFELLAFGAKAIGIVGAATASARVMRVLVVLLVLVLVLLLALARLLLPATLLLLQPPKLALTLALSARISRASLRPLPARSVLSPALACVAPLLLSAGAFSTLTVRLSLAAVVGVS